MFLTQMNSDAYVPLAQTSIASAYANGAQATYELRWDTDIFFIIICVLSVFITVHLWFLAGERLRLIVDCMCEKMAGRNKTAYENTRFVLPRKRQSYIITSTNRV